jgi:hypothetical protein
MEPRGWIARVYTLSGGERIMVKIQRWKVLFGALMASSLALAAEPRPMPHGIAPPTRIPDPLPLVVPGQPVAAAVMPREVRRVVVADAARRFKVAQSAVVLAGAEQLTWNDASLGCPQPGQMYTRTLVPGFRVVAKTTGGELIYHTDSQGLAVVCGP